MAWKRWSLIGVLLTVGLTIYALLYLYSSKENVPILPPISNVTEHVINRVYSKISPVEKCNGCFAYNYKTILQPSLECALTEEITAILLITTIPSEIEARKAMRETWLPKNTGTVRHLFLFGATKNKTEQKIIQKELFLHGDVLQDDFVDNYYNLSHKVIMGYRWVAKHCPQAQYVIRTACDNYVNIPQLLQLFSVFKSELSNAWFGLCTKTAPPNREPSGKWYVTYTEYEKEVYPPYCTGTTFGMPFRVMMNFLRVYSDTAFFPIEDSYFGFCALKFEVDILNINGFYAECIKRGQIKNRDCLYQTPVFSIHFVEPKDHKNLHILMKDQEIMTKSKLRSNIRIDNLSNDGFNILIPACVLSVILMLVLIYVLSLIF